MAYFIVLAKTAKKIAGRDKYGPGAMASHQRALFTEVWAETGNNSPPSCPAITRFSFQTIHPASPGAKLARLQQGKQRFKSSM